MHYEDLENDIAATILLNLQMYDALLKYIWYLWFKKYWSKV